MRIKQLSLSKFEIDQNTLANTIPTIYRKVKFDFENYDDLVNTNKRRKPSKSRADKARQKTSTATQKRQLDVVDEESSDEESSDEEVPQAKKRCSNSFLQTPLSIPSARPSTTVRRLLTKFHESEAWKCF